MVADRGWKRLFDEPIPTPKDRPLVTLKDAAAYIMALPKKEAGTAEWQAAIEGSNAGRGVGRTDYVRAHRHHASVEPRPRSRV
jgi:hypothetical protein